MSNTLYFWLSIDHEPSKEKLNPTVSGPNNYPEGEKSVRALLEIAKRYGAPITHFVSEENFDAQPGLIRELKAMGHTIGGHGHPFKTSINKHDGEKFYNNFGGLSPGEINEYLDNLMAACKKATGDEMICWRPGTMSQNDHAYPILAAKGIKFTSCCAPGRHYPTKQAVWTSRYPDAHYASATFRGTPGSLDIVEVPVNVDFDNRITTPGGIEMYADPRPDINFPEQFKIPYEQMIPNIIDQTMKRNAPIKAINTLTHNMYPYWDPSAPETKRVETILRVVTEYCREKNIDLKFVTLGDIYKEYKALYPEPIAPPVEIEGMVGN